MPGAANPDVRATLQQAVTAVNALPVQPAFVIHTGDVTHLSKAAEFDDARAILSGLRAPLLTIPGEHDVIGAEGPKRFAAAFGRSDARGRGWSSWDQGGAHFVALINVGEGETMGMLGDEQLAWLADDLAARRADTPVVVFGHVPLFAAAPEWGWTTDGRRQGAGAAAALRRGDRAQRPHPPGARAPGRRDPLRHRARDRVPPGRARHAGRQAGAAGRRAGLAARGARLPHGAARPARGMARPDAGAGLSGVEAPGVAFDGPAFETAYRAYAPRLRAVAYDVLRDREAAQDAVHTALVRVWSAGAYRPERGALLPFLIACVRREALDAARAARRRHLREARAAGDPVMPDVTAALDPVEAQRIARALAALPAAQRDVIVRAYYGHHTLAEIAHEHDLPLGTVKSRLSQALRRLHLALSGGA